MNGSMRMLCATLTSLVTTLFLAPLCIRILRALKTGCSFRTEICPGLKETHQSKKETPTMGGILIIFSLLLSLLLWNDLRSPYTHILLLTTLWLGLLGGCDDYLKIRHKNSKGLSMRSKLFFQMTLSLLIGFYFLSFSESHLFFIPALSTPFLIPPVVFLILTIFVITGSSNAVNLTDGLDGLATGTTFLTAMVLAIIAFVSQNKELSSLLHILYLPHSIEVAIYLSALIGSCLGFLWYNGAPASIFMGDTGSLALGGILGVSAVLLRKELLFALAGGIFVAEAISVILQVLSYRYRNKKRIFLCTPLHHHFEYLGWPETKVVIRFWIVGLILALLALVSLKIQ